MKTPVTHSAAARHSRRRGQITLGPKGRNVVLDKKFGAPTITNDGVTIAKDIELDDRFENIGAQLAKEVAVQDQHIAGDGTTTATVLAQAIVRKVSRTSPRARTRWASNADSSRPPKRTARRHQGAGDAGRRPASRWRRSLQSPLMRAPIGELIGEVDGESRQRRRRHRRRVEGHQHRRQSTSRGMNFDRGYISPYLVTDPERMEAVIEDPYILITERKSRQSTTSCRCWRSFSRSQRTSSSSPTTSMVRRSATLAVNKLRGTLIVARGQSSRLGDRRKDNLKRPRHLPAVQVISDELGRKLDT